MKRFAKYTFLILLAAALLFVRTGFLLVRPGSAEDLSAFVSVENGMKEEEGDFYLVTVVQQEATPLQMLRAVFDPIIDLRHKSSSIPPEMDREGYQEIMEQWMKESQDLAKVIALRRMGYEVPVKSDGIRVVEIEENSPAKGILQPEDVITAVDGKIVYLTEELINEVGEKPIGSDITLTIRRGNKKKDVAVTTVSHSEHPEKSGLRVYVQTLNWQPVLPLEIDIQVGKITGPSAGIMFVLEILNQLDDKDLTAGHKIAGTGTINLQEKVGAIGGVRQKVRAAEEIGAEFFIVPQENYQEAAAAVRNIKLVSVETLDDALRFLESLQAAAE